MRSLSMLESIMILGGFPWVYDRTSDGEALVIAQN